MTKKELRIKYKALRKGLSKETRLAYDALLCDKIIQVLEKQSHVGIFLPMTKHQEVDLRQLLALNDYLWYVPVSNMETGEMEFCSMHPSTVLKENSWGILEPELPLWVDAEKLDALVIPLLISDKAGYRVGYGKGFYDRFITKCRPDCLKIGVNYFEPVEEIFDIDNFDKALNICITPKNVS